MGGVSASLNRSIAIQAPPVGQDANGERLTEWTTIAEVWAEVSDMSGRQYMAAAAGQNAVITKITIRYRPGIVAAMRVVHGADIYDIEAVLGQDRRWLELMCVRGVSNG